MRVLIIGLLWCVYANNWVTQSLYSDKDFKSCMDKIEVIDYHTTVTHKGIQFCGYVAGHVLGAAMFAICIDGVRVLYTGDYSMEEDRCVCE